MQDINYPSLNFPPINLYNYSTLSMTYSDISVPFRVIFYHKGYVAVNSLGKTYTEFEANDKKCARRVVNFLIESRDEAVPTKFDSFKIDEIS